MLIHRRTLAIVGLFLCMIVSFVGALISFFFLKNAKPLPVSAPVKKAQNNRWLTVTDNRPGKIVDTVILVDTVIGLCEHADPQFINYFQAKSQAKKLEVEMTIQKGLHEEVFMIASGKKDATRRYLIVINSKATELFEQMIAIVAVQLEHIKLIETFGRPTNPLLSDITARVNSIERLEAIAKSIANLKLGESARILRDQVIPEQRAVLETFRRMLDQQNRESAPPPDQGSQPTRADLTSALFLFSTLVNHPKI